METKLIIKNTQECMNIINSIRENTYPKEKEKYASYISMNYFVKNLHNFDKKDIDIILNDEKLSFSISSKLSYELLENAIKNKTIFASYSKKWFHNVKNNQELLQQYLPILLDSNDNQQIEDFCNANPVLSKSYFKNNKIENYTFEKYVIGNNPSLITKNMLLSEEDIIELVHKNLVKYEHLKEVLNQYSYRFQTIVTEEEVNKILKYNIEDNEEKKDEILNLVSENSLFFIKRIQQLNPEFTKRLLSSLGKTSFENNFSTSLNFLQSIILEESIRKKSFEELMVIALYDYKDILFTDVNCSLGVMKYTYTKNYFIKLYENKNYEVFKGLALFNKELDSYQREIVLNACFEGLFDSYQNSRINTNYKFDISQNIKPLLTFPYESLFKKLNELKNLKAEENILSELEKYFLYNKLNENLNESKNKENIIKVE